LHEVGTSSLLNHEVYLGYINLPNATYPSATVKDNQDVYCHCQ